jgi:carboxypeptidase C (cathepsin A)
MARIAKLVGLPERVVRDERGRISRRVFAREIRRPEGEIVSLYDATVTRAAPPGSGGGYGSGAGDPVLDPAIAAYTAAFAVYAPRELGYRTLEPYRVLPRTVSRQWDWQGAQHGEGYGSALAALDAALLAHPTIKVLIVDGRYDLVAPYLLTRWLVDQMALPPAALARIRLRVYPGGHMMYMRPQSRALLARDAAAIYAAPVVAPAATPAAPLAKAPEAAAQKVAPAAAPP